MTPAAPTRWVVALDAEAGPIRARHGLTKAVHGGPFVVFHDPEARNWLVVSGIGSALAAGATAFLAERSAAPQWAIWLNVGVAGHATAPLGSVHFAHTVVDVPSGRTTYATIAVEVPIPGCALHTVPRPETVYPDPVLYDMEGSGFYAVARRLSTAELVHSVKVVSDNRATPVERFSAARVKTLVEAGLDAVGDFHQRLISLSATERARLTPPRCYGVLVDRHPLSATQRHQLANHLRRWWALGLSSEALESAAADGADGRDFLGRLERALECAAPGWLAR
jgi:hypothetical protein